VIDVVAVGIGILIGVGVLTVAGVARGGWATARAIADLRRFVIPHFVPPTPDEIRLGAEDNTMPARLERQEKRLTDHLTTEERESRRMWGELEVIRQATSPGGS
jgi:hypothetical protein